MEKEPRKYISRTGICALITITLCIIYSVSSCSRKTAYDPHHGVPQCEITATVDSLVNAYFPDVESGQNPGGIITVMRGDSIVYNRSFGYGRLDKPQLITDSTVLNISSVSKLFTGVAIAKLIEDSLISPFDTISEYFPSFPEKYFGRITIADVLSHASGLPDLRPAGKSDWDEYIESHKSIFGYERDYRLYGTEQEFLRTFENLDTIAYEPGTHYDRYDISYVLMAPLIEAVTGCEFNKWMDENLFRPAGMTETFYYDPFKIHPRQAHGYKKCDGTEATSTFRSDDGCWSEYDYDEVDYFLTKADRGAWSSARDIMRFFRALHQGKLISRQSIDRMIQPLQITSQPNVSYGLGIPVERKPGYAPKAYHMNANGGFGALDCWWPDSDVCYVILTNRNDWTQRPLMFAIDNMLRAFNWVD